MIARLDRLADLGTTVVSISGGEPLMHPELDDIRGAHSPAAHDGGHDYQRYLLTAERIKRLESGRARSTCRFSIDNVMPDDVSKKSLKVLDKKLRSWRPTPSFM